MKIEDKNLKYMEHSLIDNIGRVFEYEGNIYRGIYTAQEQHVHTLFDCGLISELIKNKLFPKTKIVNISTDQFSLVLQHEAFFISYPNQWTFDMLKDAALLTLKVNEIALKFGYQLKDAHGYNVLFKNNRPVFIDIGSFIEIQAYCFLRAEEFLQAFCVPLVLMSKGEMYLAHKLLIDPYFPKSRLLVGEMPHSLHKHVYCFYDLVIRFLNSSFHLPLNKVSFPLAKLFLKACFKLKLNKEFVKVDLSKNIVYYLNELKYSHNSPWANYHNEFLKDDKVVSTSRFDYILSAVKSLNKSLSVLDIAANQGLLPILLHKEIGFEKITHIDYDINACNDAYLFYAKNNLPINIVCINFLELMDNKKLCKRLRSDIVFGLALTHHLILSQSISLPILLNTFLNLTNKYIIIEFMPLGLWNGNSTPSLPSWYSIHWFRDNFKQYFKLIREEKIEKNRIVFIGEKI